MLRLNTIKAHPGATTPKKRLGRGSGSGHGPTAGKGDKGQLARSGGTSRPGFEGGQTPLYRRIPKRGFTSFVKADQAIINVGDLERLDVSALSEISLESLKTASIVKGRHMKLVVLGTGELKKSLTIKAHRISPSAEQKITAAGGSVQIVQLPSLREKRLVEDRAQRKTKTKTKKKI